MPVRNQLFGVYRLLQLKGAGGAYKPYIVESASRSRDMEVNAKNFVQGTAKARILDIGGIKETIEMKLPILVGPASELDGRTFIKYYLKEALNAESTILPLVSSAKINISAEGGASVSATLLSDGRPSTAAFKVTSLNPDTDLGTLSGKLDPTQNGGPSRVAKFYDFRAKIGKFVYYIMSAEISIEVETKNQYFIAGVQDSAFWQVTEQYEADAMNSGHGNPMASTDGNNYFNFNTQFPFIGVSGIKVSGSGTAAVELSNTVGGPLDYDFEDYASNPPAGPPRYEAVNVDFSETAGPDGKQYELTWQRPGEVITADYIQGDANSGFLLEIFDPTINGGDYNASTAVGGEWVSLFKDNGVDIINLSKTVVNKSNFKIDTGVMTADFSFTSWVK